LRIAEARMAAGRDHRSGAGAKMAGLLDKEVPNQRYDFQTD
jgi:hypothetical protein